LGVKKECGIFAVEKYQHMPPRIVEIMLVSKTRELRADLREATNIINQ
jgi:hypothetical protein